TLVAQARRGELGIRCALFREPMREVEEIVIRPPLLDALDADPGEHLDRMRRQRAGLEKARFLGAWLEALHDLVGGGPQPVERDVRGMPESDASAGEAPVTGRLD